MRFIVTDIHTGEYPDLSSIVLGEEDWAWGGWSRFVLMDFT